MREDGTIGIEKAEGPQPLRIPGDHLDDAPNTSFVTSMRFRLAPFELKFEEVETLQPTGQ